MNCTHCDREIAPNRAIVLRMGCTDTTPGVELVFCLTCHPEVFTECDWQRYPDLFDPWCEWSEELGRWQTGKELARRLDVSTRWLANTTNKTGMAFGWPVETCGNRRSRRYRLIKGTE